MIESRLHSEQVADCYIPLSGIQIGIVIFRIKIHHFLIQTVDKSFFNSNTDQCGYKTLGCGEDQIHGIFIPVIIIGFRNQKTVFHNNQAVHIGFLSSLIKSTFEYIPIQSLGLG